MTSTVVPPTGTARRTTGGLALRPYQAECVDALLRDLLAPDYDEGRHPHLAVVLPTGTGKTVVFSALGDAWRGYVGGDIMILAHRKELIDQAVQKYCDVVPGAEIGVIKGARHDVRDVTVASVPSLHADRRARLGSWRPSLLIIDESHHATAKSYRDIIGWAGCPVVGVTATLSRSDGVALGRAGGGIFDKISYQKTILWMIRHGYLADVEGKRVVVDDLDLEGLRRVGGDYSDGQVGQRLMSSVAPEAVAASILKYCPDKPGVIFAPTVESARAFTIALQSAGLSCATIWGTMPAKDRDRVVDDYRAGRLQWMSNCMVLTEGWDAPRAAVAVIARPTQSEGLYVQMVGRVLRPYPGKQRALVLDVVGASVDMELCTLAVLAGEPPEQTERKSLLDEFGAPCTACGVPRDECLPESRCCQGCSHYRSHADQELVETPTAFTVVEADLFAGSRQQWLTTHAGHWFLPLGDRIVAIAPRPDGGYDTFWAWVDKRGGDYIATRVSSLEYAMAHGEAAITDEEEYLARKARPWRKQPCSQAQIWKARQLGVYRPEMESWRKGQVSDEISRALTSKRIDGMIARRIKELP